MDQDEAPTTPYGGTEQIPVVLTEPEVARPKSEPFGLKDYTKDQPQPATASEPSAPLPPKGPSFLERMQAAAQFTSEQAEALAPCEARQLFNETGYESLSEDVEIQLASGVVVKGQAAGQFDGWVQVTPCRGNDGWPVEAKDALYIAAPISTCVWPGRMSTVPDSNNQQEPND